jgi:hypothetical protein
MCGVEQMLEWDSRMICKCGHDESRHVKSFTGKRYCIDCPCGHFNAKGFVKDDAHKQTKLKVRGRR